MKTCIIARFDFNGVIANPGALLRCTLSQLVGVRIPAATFDKTVVGKEFPLLVDRKEKRVITQEAYDESKKIVYGNEFLTVPPMPGARDAIAYLVDNGVQVSIVTNAATISGLQMSAWLQKNRFPPIDVIFTRGNSKRPYLGGADIVVDNEFNQLEPLLSHTKGQLLVQFVPEKNATGTDNTNARIRDEAVIPIARGWAKVLALVEEFMDNQPSRILLPAIDGQAA